MFISGKQADVHTIRANESQRKKPMAVFLARETKQRKQWR